MKIIKFTLLILLVISIPNLNAQDCLITFAASGASTTVTSVRVDNLTQGTNLTMNGSEVLHLLSTITGIESISQNQKNQISFSPNPMTDYSILKFDLPEHGMTSIGLYDLWGRKIAALQDFLSKGRQTYRLEGIEKGIYFVTINSAVYSASGKLVCTGSSQSGVKILRQNSSFINDSEKDIFLNDKKKLSKGLNSEIFMQYTSGDRLKLTGTSGNYSTIITDIPASSKTITFNFVDCTDGDGFCYPVVVIGPQTWMAENLKTTKYNDGTEIPNVTANATWAALTTQAYCDYNNSLSNSDTYGRLYNWYVVDDNASTKVTSNGGKKVCPIGWHVPSYSEWESLIIYLGGESVAGGKLKESGTTHWFPPNEGATNETVFTALPGGDRHTDGVFVNLGFLSFWWSTTEYNTFSSRCFAIQKIYSNIESYTVEKNNGQTVRCLSD